jgi:OFA family oxalate/formate antiporter-like MFS transporter
MFGMSAAILAPIMGYLLNELGYVTMTVVLGLVALCMGVVAAQFTEVPQVTKPGSQSRAAHRMVANFDLDHSLPVNQSVQTGSFSFLWLTWALQGAACIAMITLSTAYGLSKGFNLESAVIILTAFNLASGISRLLGGMLSEVVGRNLVMSMTFFASGLSYFVLPHVDNLVGLAWLAGVIGFAFVTMFAVSAPLTVDCFGILHFGAVSSGWPSPAMDLWQVLWAVL